RRAQSAPALCRNGQGLPGDSVEARCDYVPAPFFNVLAAYWIQFMTHDWFSHLDEGHNASAMMPAGCSTKRVASGDGIADVALTADEIAKLGCRPDDRIDQGYIAQDSDPATFSAGGKEYL